MGAQGIYKICSLDVEIRCVVPIHQHSGCLIVSGTLYMPIDWLCFFSIIGVALSFE